MQDLDAFQLTAAAIYALFASVYGAFVRKGWWHAWWIFGSTAGILIPFVGAAASVRFALFTAMSLTPESLWSWSTIPAWLVALSFISEWAIIWSAAASPHVWRLIAGHARAPGRIWVAANYVPAAVLSAATIALLTPGAQVEDLYAYLALRYCVIVLWFALAAFELRRPLQASSWNPGFAGARAGRLDFAVIAAVVLILAFLAPLIVHVQPSPLTVFHGDQRWVFLFFETVVTLLLLLPWVARTRGEYARAAAVGGGLVLVTALALYATRAAVDPLAEAGLARLATVVVAAVVLALAALTRPAVEGAIDRLIVRRRLRQWERLESVVRTLPAEEGVVSCAQQLTDALVEQRLFEGAALLLDDGVVVSAGQIDVTPLRSVWSTEDGATALSFAAAMLSPNRARTAPKSRDDLPESVLAALAAARVISIVPIASARRSWGCLCFGLTRPFAVPVSDEDRRGLTLAAELALVLDAAALVERAVGTQRSLAHAEKLAAVGETAARIAHEIRSPVTAARSLAQMLARNPTSPRSAEQAQLILSELQRVERQVAALLGFSRREEFRFEPVALDDLVRDTVAGLRPRLSEGGVAVALDIAGNVITRGDREKIRQLLTNLIQNSIDAMSEDPSPRCLRVAVNRTNGSACVAVSDTGGGIPRDLLPHVFEPFRSGKPHGTGLGLAIAKQTVDAHGGRIAVAPAAERGTCVTVHLPLVEKAPAS